jgi:PPOX class probable F420-dependent enzyme
MDAGRREDAARHNDDEGAEAMSGLPDDVRPLFEGANIAHLATIMPDGSPHSAPLWVDVEADRIVFFASPGSRNARNLERDPRLCISITDANQPFTMAQVRGQVVARKEDDAAWRTIDRISRKYTGQPHDVRTDRVLYSIELNHAVAHAFG